MAAKKKSAGPSSVKTICKKITPKMAADLMKDHTKNRRLRNWTIKRLVNDIQNGRWRWNGQPIIVDKNGVVLDGYHRLHAIIEAGIAVESLIVTGVPTDAVHTMDSGQARDARDAFHIERGFSWDVNARFVPALRLCMVYETTGLDFGWERRGRFTNAEMIEAAKRHPDLEKFTKFHADGIGRRAPTAHGFVIFLHYLTSKYLPKESEEFFTGLRDGDGLKRGTAVYSMREWINRNIGTMVDKKNRRNRLPLLILAWNAHVEGGSLDRVRTPVNFPEIILSK